MEAISVVIPSYRNPAYLDLCLRSAFENQDNENQIIVVLDGFAEESQDVIKKYPDLNVIEFEENKGQMVAHNTGVTLAENEWVLIVNDDNVFPRHWDTKLKPFLHRTTEVFAPNQIEPAPSIFKSFVIKDLGTTPETFKYEEFLDFSDSCDRSEIDYEAGTWPLFITKRNYMILGGIDQNFPHAPVADWDFFLRCELMGLSLTRHLGIHLYHFAGSSTKTIDKGWGSKEQQSHEYFNYKWGFYGQFGPNNSHVPKGQTYRGIRFE
jgi:glycosyltransferase involved in cell wall biosynthesis